MRHNKFLIPVLLTVSVMAGVVGRASANTGLFNSKGRIESENVVFDATDFITVIDAYESAKKTAYIEGFDAGASSIVEKPFVIEKIHSYGAQVSIGNTWRSYSHSFNIVMHPNSLAITMMNDSRASHQYVVSSNNDNIQVDHILNTSSPQYVGLLRNTSNEEQTATIYMQNSIYGGTGEGADNIAYYIFTCE